MSKKVHHYFAGMIGHFEAVHGVNAMKHLAGLVSSSKSVHPIITIGGDQCTGKSTLAGKLANMCGGTAVSMGSLFRQEAKKRGISVAQFSKLAKAEPLVDVELEYECAKMLCSGYANGPLIIEGRQPAVVASLVKKLFQKPRVISLYLSCSRTEQCLRFLEREVGKKYSSVIALHLDHNKYASILEDADGLSRICPELDRLLITNMVEKWVETKNRDVDDRLRYASLYGDYFEIDYRNPALYDIVIETTFYQSTDTYQFARKELAAPPFNVHFVDALISHQFPACPSTPLKAHL